MKLKRITSRYPGNCRKCGGSISKRQEIFWSKETGPLCLVCGNEDPGKADAPKAGDARIPKPSSKNRWTIDWAELKEILKNGIAGTIPEFRSSRNREKFNSYTNGLPVNSGGWHGFTKGQAERWLKEGYATDAIKGLAEFIPPIREKRKLRFTDEGDEFHLDLAYSGDDNFMSEWSKRETIPGLAIHAVVGFSSATDAKIVNQYIAWICKLCYSLDAAGIDLEVSFENKSKDLFNQDRSVHSTLIRVKKENEAADFSGWSAMLSPAGWRSFCFCAFALNADSRGYDVMPHLGICVTEEWKVEYEKEAGILHIEPKFHGAPNFPESLMDSKLREAIKEIMNK